MSTNGRGARAQYGTPSGGLATQPGSGNDVQRRAGENGHADLQPGGGASRRKRRRQRSQRGKRRQPTESRAPQIDLVSRERIFQELEGLLRQIREQAEEGMPWPQERLDDFTQAVVSFTKSLEEQGEAVSDRVRSEYQRIRDKLSQALKG